MDLNTTFNMDCLEGLRGLGDCSIDCCVTSPPYFALRDYGCDGQIGLERSPEEYISRLVEVFREVLRVLKPEGTCWVVIGDTYAGAGKGAAKYPENAKLWKQGSNAGTLDRATSYKYQTEAKDRDLIGIPWMLAFALRGIGFYLRQDIIWHKPNPMPESVTCRCTKAHEYVFLLSKSRVYFFDHEAMREPANTGIRELEFNHRKVDFLTPNQRYKQFRGSGSNSDGKRTKRDVWTIPLRHEKDNTIHHATFPEELPSYCILAGCPAGGVVLDPFMGSGTTGLAAVRYGRNFIGFELNRDYCELANKRTTECKRQLKLF